MYAAALLFHLCRRDPAGQQLFGNRRNLAELYGLLLDLVTTSVSDEQQHAAVALLEGAWSLARATSLC